MTKPKKLRLRGLGSRDAIALARIDKELFAADAWDTEDFREALQSVEYSGHAVMLGRTMVAYCLNLQILEDGNDRLHVASVATLPRWQRLGLANLLMAHTYFDAISMEFDKVSLEMHERNSQARNLYESLGFKQSGAAVPNYYADAGAAVPFERQLNEADKQLYTAEYCAQLLRKCNQRLRARDGTCAA